MTVPDTAPEGHHEHRHAKLKPILKPLIVIGVLFTALLIVYLSPLKSYLKQVDVVRDHIQALGFWGPVIYMFCVFGLVALGVPRLLFCPIGGLVFGLFWGLVWTQIPTLLGYYVIFLFVRWGGHDFVLRHWPRLGHMHRVFHKRAIPTIIVIRQLPISGLIINLLLGLSPINHSDFLIGTVIGLLPEAILMTAIGSSAIKLTAGQGLAYVAGILAFLVVLWTVFALIVRSSKMFARLRADFEEDEFTENEDGE